MSPTDHIASPADLQPGMTVGVFGGSFNPVHTGHISLAREVVARGLAAKVLMVLSPLNPLKENPAELVDDLDRFEMLRIACAPYPELIPSAVELSMPRPSYTVDTLRRLGADHPGVKFRLIIGADNWQIFDRWKDYGEILRDYSPVVYPRSGFPMPLPGSGADPLEAGLYEISSTDIRRGLRNGRDMNKTLPPGVLDYIRRHSLYT